MVRRHFPVRVLPVRVRDDGLVVFVYHVMVGALYYVATKDVRHGLVFTVYRLATTALLVRQAWGVGGLASALFFKFAQRHVRPNRYRANGP